MRLSNLAKVNVGVAETQTQAIWTGFYVLHHHIELSSEVASSYTWLFKYKLVELK